MTEQEWLESTEVQRLIEYLEGRGSDRKYRLFGCACCRRAWELLTDARSRTAVEVCEQFADGLVDFATLEVAHQNADEAVEANVDTWRDDNLTAFDAVRTIAETRAYSAADLAADTLRNYVSVDQREQETAAQLALLRDIFGNPFRPVKCDPAWRTAQAVAVARTVYDERQFDDLPLLADALEEAGCADGAILSHCRGPGPHVRGCWVVDLILGKE